MPGAIHYTHCSRAQSTSLDKAAILFSCHENKYVSSEFVQYNELSITVGYTFRPIYHAGGNFGQLSLSSRLETGEINLASADDDQPLWLGLGGVYSTIVFACVGWRV